MTEEIKEKTKFNFLKAITNPIALILIGGVISYYLGEYLNRDKIEIVEVTVRSKPINLDGKNYWKYIEYINSYNNQEEKKADTIRTLSIEDIKKLVKSYSTRINSYSTYLDNSDKYKYSNNGIDTIYNQQYRDIKNELILEKQGLLHTIKGDLMAAENDFYIELVVRNKGNQQGILKYKANVSIDNRKINLRKYQATLASKNQVGELLENYITIESKSFNGMLLDIDKYFNNPSDVSAVSKEFELRQKTASITIYAVDRDSKDEILVDTYDFMFRDDLVKNEYGNVTKIMSDLEKL